MICCMLHIPALTGQTISQVHQYITAEDEVFPDCAVVHFSSASQLANMCDCNTVLTF